MEVLKEAIRDASAWKGSDFRSKEDITLHFETEHLDEIDATLKTARDAGLGLDTLERRHFELPRTTAFLQDAREELRSGRGIAILRGIDASRYSVPELEMIYWGIGTHFGVGVSQSVLGDRLGHVKDTTATDPHARAYRNKQELTPHTDTSDIVGLMCVRTARHGGVSIASSVAAVHNVLLERFPQYLEPLYEGFPYHRRGENLPGEAPITPHRIPVFSYVQGQLSTRYARSYIETAARESGKPLNQLQIDALNCLEQLTYEVAFEFQLDPGEIYLLNNYAVLHARTAFENWPEPERARLLLRLWLTADDWRHLDPRIEATRGGISAQAGKLPSFERAFGSGRIATQSK
ncbi:TauD/TfdA family dioxygenase [Variovorax sp. Sphag1AA]|uniref:TauD/TfdA family dioxygenase n=1 Tax=Variovorax sp. Sphag1AA TaxID=2587027 RepID=UPI00161F5F0E|nr:TauD/TfdA family dioxygenase [Variovorax sp. Sphag1AA]MBB3182442.1 hypothetical protein [Variovorax sp. Sphag1AA]